MNHFDGIFLDIFHFLDGKISWNGFSEIDLFDFTSFFGLEFFWPAVKYTKYRIEIEMLSVSVRPSRIFQIFSFLLHNIIRKNLLKHFCLHARPKKMCNNVWGLHKHSLDDYFR